MNPGLMFALSAASLFIATAGVAASAPIKSDLDTIRKVGPEGRGNTEAGRAWQELTKADAAAIPAILAAMDDANELAANYLRSAVDAIADRELSAGRTLPLPELEKFLADTRHNPRARRLAYELMVRIAPANAERLLPGFVNDPSIELRLDAVQRLIDQAERAYASQQIEAATTGFQQALNHARDEAQIKKIAGRLRNLEQDVDLPKHFGFLTHWKVIGPFDNTQLKGFEAVYPPQKEIKLAAEYDGKEGKVRWVDGVTGHEYGLFDINRLFGELKGAVAYAYTEFESDSAQAAELRLGCKNGWKIWLNGQFVFGRDEYHRGSRIDQYRLPVELKAGKNTLLVKVCQNEDVKDWTKEWEFQLRVCDATGTAILAKNRPPTPPANSNATAKKAAKQ